MVVRIFLKRSCLLPAALALAEVVFAQNGDTLPKRDTLSVYRKIRKVAYRHKWTQFLYHSVFVDPAPQVYEEKPLSDEQKMEDPNLKFQGRTIRRIDIEVFDPFGYSVNDTNKRDVHALQRIGNGYHTTTRRRIIRNMLLFAEGDTFDLLKITESERLVREAAYVNDAHIYAEAADEAWTDSVDVKVVVKDKWAIDAWGDISPSQGNITLRDKNIAGAGQRYQQYVSYAFNGVYELTGTYHAANISSSFISSTAFYKLRKDFTRAGLSFERPFYSALAKWAGGLSAAQTWDVFRRTDTADGTAVQAPLRFLTSDEWIARSIATQKRGGANRRVTNLIAAVRHAGTQYLERPDSIMDPGKSSLNSQLYLTSIGFSINKYYKDQYIFRFGANEDIPEGLIAQALYGVSHAEGGKIVHYNGCDIAYGKHFHRLGYCSFRISYGNFLNPFTSNNTTVSCGLTFFTDLLKGGRWYYRQFIYMKYVDGFNKPAGDRIILRKEELYGFTGSPLGRSKALLNLEGVTYAPYNLLGFKFAPVVLMGFGMISTDSTKLFTGRVFQSYALGMLLRNENLVTSSLEVTFGFYPYYPAGGKNYRLNPVTGFSIKFRNFSVFKPTLIAYE